MKATRMSSGIAVPDITFLSFIFKLSLYFFLLLSNKKLYFSN